MSESTPEELAKEATKPGTFRFSDVLRGRGYPTEVVTIWTDEKAAYPLVELAEKIDTTRNQLSLTEKGDKLYAALAKNLKGLEAEREEIKASVAPSKYDITVTGIPQGIAEDLLGEAKELYPVEYEIDYNPFTGERVKTEVESLPRARWYANSIWLKQTVKIVDPNGAEAEDIDFDTVASMRRTLPRNAQETIQDAMNKVNMAVSWFDAMTDESFLAKS